MDLLRIPSHDIYTLFFAIYNASTFYDIFLSIVMLSNAELYRCAIEQRSATGTHIEDDLMLVQIFDGKLLRNGQRNVFA